MVSASVHFVTLLSFAFLGLTACDSPTETFVGTQVTEESAGLVLVAGQPHAFPCDPIITPNGGWIVGDTVALAVKADNYRWRCLLSTEWGSIEVFPGPAVRVEWVNLGDAVRLGRSVEPLLVSRDLYGNPVDEKHVVESFPESAVQREGARLRFVENGTVILRARSEAGLLAQREILVDSGPPIVELHYPPRGSITRHFEGEMRVSGRVLEDGPNVVLYIDGKAVPVGPDGRFETHIEPNLRAGLQVIDYRAVDATFQETTGSRAFLHGELRDPRNGLDEAARVVLPGWLLDDNDDDLDDLASAVKLLMGLVPVPDQRVSLGCNGAVDLEDIRLRVNDLDLIPLDGEIEVRVSLRDVSLDIDGEACACAWGGSVACLSVRGSVSTDQMVVDLTASVGKSAPTSLEVTDATLTLSPLSIHWDFFYGSLDWVLELFEEEIRSRLVGAFESAVQERVQGNLRALLESILPIHTITLPPPLDDAVALETQLRAVSVSRDGLIFDLRLESMPPDAMLPSTSLPGQYSSYTISASGGIPRLPAGEVGIGVSLDVINDAIYSLYTRGALEEVVIDLDQYGAKRPQGLVGPVSLSARLPPMLLAGANDGELSLVVGDLKVSADTLGEPVAFYLSFVVPATLAFNEQTNELILRLETDGIEVHFEPESAADAVALSATFDDLERVLRTVVSESVLHRSMRIPLPILDLSKIQGVPPLVARRVQLSGATIEVQASGFVIASGRIREAD
ncbi:MAG: hypothetical protein AUK47_17755 [Deltaproteobacteria bacterium CG2_30_63_29]|nr:MAG: hypothetical protein AUK47_17755 [Deltaproteobacteria bacterium CG2_30_63_29]